MKPVAETKTFTFRGEVFVLEITTAVLESLRKKIRDTRPKALSTAVKGMEGVSEQVAEMIVRQAIRLDMSNEVTMVEVMDFARTPDGVVAICHCLVLAKFPNATTEEIRAEIDREVAAAQVAAKSPVAPQEG